MLIEALLAAAPTPVPLTVGGHTFRMVPVRGGTFDMGDEVGDLWDACRPVHRVQLDDFWMGQFLVTQALWRAVCSPSPALPKGEGENLDANPSFFKGDHRPVERVLWKDTQVFLEKLNQLLPGWNFRLPTEAEWEYAARGGHHVTLPLGEGRGGATRYAGGDRLEAVAWWDGNSHNETNSVGLKAPNALGLFDMSGNVWEWCEDWLDGKFYEKCAKKGTVSNPRKGVKGSTRVLRGGSWRGGNLRHCRVVSRIGGGSADSDYNGFRLAASPSSSVISA